MRSRPEGIGNSQETNADQCKEDIGVPLVSVTVNEAAKKRRPNGAYDIPGAGADSDTGSRNNRRHYRIDADKGLVRIRSEEEYHRKHRRNNGIELGRTPDNPLIKQYVPKDFPDSSALPMLLMYFTSDAQYPVVTIAITAQSTSAK